MSSDPKEEARPAALRREWRRRQERALERATQLDLFVDREAEAAQAREKLKEIYAAKRGRGRQ